MRIHRLSVVVVAILLSEFHLRLAAADPPAGPTTAPSAADRRVIRMVQCSQHLKQIGDAIVLYSLDHKGEFPPDLGTLATAGHDALDVSYFVCPAAGALPKGWRTMAKPDQATWINAHTDYIYLGSKMSTITATSDVPLAYEKDDDHDGRGMHVLFGDGRVEFLSMKDVHKLLGPKVGAERLTTRIYPWPDRQRRFH